LRQTSNSPLGLVPENVQVDVQVVYFVAFYPQPLSLLHVGLDKVEKVVHDGGAREYVGKGVVECRFEVEVNPFR
jgi:hypothetical protein